VGKLLNSSGLQLSVSHSTHKEVRRITCDNICKKAEHRQKLTNFKVGIIINISGTQCGNIYETSIQTLGIAAFTFKFSNVCDGEAIIFYANF
jgi:hypothetical protein